ncbi:MAG TPA: cytochrome b/b6 domain-containing protein [Geminicoccaceae bacterium]|nr:cytochrome b/b6 domain-containing protein [Geminicoccaceae bacterium]
MRSDQPARSTVLVWDAPTRLFHWTLVLLVALAWVTGEAEGSLFTVHELAGYGVAVLLLFRVIWGFAGSRHSRFADFLRPWPAVRAHVSGMLRLRPARTLGHNPLGGWMALLLLVVLAAQVGTGLFAADGALGGPLAGAVAPATAHAIAELHEGLSGALLGLIGLHVVGVLAESLLTRDNLVRAMITGRKEVSPGAAVGGHGAALAPAWLAALALGTASGIVWMLVA